MENEKGQNGLTWVLILFHFLSHLSITPQQHNPPIAHTLSPVLPQNTPTPPPNFLLCRKRSSKNLSERETDGEHHSVFLFSCKKKENGEKDRARDRKMADGKVVMKLSICDQLSSESLTSLFCFLHLHSLRQNFILRASSGLT